MSLDNCEQSKLDQVWYNKKAVYRHAYRLSQWNVPENILIELVELAARDARKNKCHFAIGER